MNKDEKAIAALTRDILVSYFCENRLDMLFAHLAEDIVYLGSNRRLETVGSENVQALFRANDKGLMPFDIYGEKYIARMLTDDYGFCEAFFDMCTKPGHGVYISGQQRSTFIYRRVQGSTHFEIVHLHNSVEYEGLEDGELMAVTLAVRNAIQVSAGENLTPRDYEIVLSAIHGSTNARIAAKLGTSEGNIKKRLSLIYRKLGVKNRAELTHFFMSKRRPKRSCEHPRLAAKDAKK